MDVRIECRDETGYIVLKISGTWTNAASILVLDTARKEATRLGVSRILLDLHEYSLPENEMMRYQAGVYLAQVLPRPYRKIGRAHV